MMSRKKRPLHQVILTYAYFSLLGLLFLGAFFDAIGNAMELVTPKIATYSSIAATLAFAFLNYYLKRKPLTWLADGQTIKIKKLGMKSLFGLLGMIALVWLPIVVDYFSEKKLDYKALMPFKSGWIFIGYIKEDQRYIEGPYATVQYSPHSERSGDIVPKIGDVLLVKKRRFVMIANYKSQGLEYQLISPPLVHDPLSDEDETGVVLPKDTLVFVRDVELSGYYGSPSSIWCRVIECEDGIESCMKALKSL